MSGVTLGLLHPGEMGATVGAAAHSAGVRVLWLQDGRSTATRERAQTAGLEPAAGLEQLVRESQMVLCVCPPHAAGEVAKQVAGAGFRGIYVDANAISPTSARALAQGIEQVGARFVDGGIIGPPARSPGTTRLYLSGDHAQQVADLFGGSALEAIAIAGPAGAASALKMAYAAYSKGSAALLLAIRALALREGIDGALLGEWSRSQPDLAARSEGSARGTARKAWRFVGEMHEIADTFAAAELPDGFHRAAAEVYGRLADFKDTDPPPDLSEVARALLERS